MACPICYEEYVFLEEASGGNPDVIDEDGKGDSSATPTQASIISSSSNTNHLQLPRKLPCGDIACTGCLKDAYCEKTSEMVCMLCMQCYVFEDGVGELPIICRRDYFGEEDGDEGEGDYLNGPESGSSTPVDEEGGRNNSSNSSPESCSPISRVAEFMREVPPSSFSQSYRDSAIVDPPILSPPKSCTIPRCPNIRGPRGYCAQHSHLHPNAAGALAVDVKEQSRAAHIRAHEKLEKAKLSRFTFQPGDRLKVLQKTDTDNASEQGEGAAAAAAGRGGGEKGARSLWGKVDPDELVARFKAHKLMQLGEVLELIDQSRDVLRQEANILNVEGPITCVGDIHGQFFDLLHLLENGGKPGPENPYLFLGDYVDRGKFSCEVVLYLLALKVCFPQHIHLIRGNHESRGTTSYFGFKEECKAKYGLPVYYRFLLCFECLPLCAVIHTSYGRIFACHGGISPDIRTLEEIEGIDRFVEPDCKGALCDILWSDPLHELDKSLLPKKKEKKHTSKKEGAISPQESAFAGDEGQQGEEGTEEAEKDPMEQFLSVGWKPNFERGCSYYFGYKAIRRFLDENDLLCLIRAHQVQEEGFRRHFDPLRLRLNHKEIDNDEMEEDRRKQRKGRPPSPLTHANIRKVLPPVITVFSAPNYCDRYGNKAAFLRIGLEPQELSFEQFDCVPQPNLNDANLPWGDLAMSSAHTLAIIKTCAYMPTTFRELFKVAKELGPSIHRSDAGIPFSVDRATEGGALIRDDSSSSLSLPPPTTLSTCGSFSSITSSLCDEEGEDEDEEEVPEGKSVLSPTSSVDGNASAPCSPQARRQQQQSVEAGAMPMMSLQESSSLSSLSGFTTDEERDSSPPQPLSLLAGSSSLGTNWPSVRIDSVSEGEEENKGENIVQHRLMMAATLSTPSFIPTEEEKSGINGAMATHSSSSSSVKKEREPFLADKSKLRKERANKKTRSATKVQEDVPLDADSKGSRHIIKDSGVSNHFSQRISVIQRMDGNDRHDFGPAPSSHRHHSCCSSSSKTTDKKGKSRDSSRLDTMCLDLSLSRNVTTTSSSNNRRFMLAQARDGINEVHPDILEKRIQVIADKLNKRRSPLWDAPASGLSAGVIDAYNIVAGRCFTVSELCARFELGMLLGTDALLSPEKVAQGVEEVLNKEEQRTEDGVGDKKNLQHSSTSQAGARVSLPNVGAGVGKLTANSVTELRGFFEVISKRHTDKQFILSSGTSTPSRGVSTGSSSSSSEDGCRSTVRLAAETLSKAKLRLSAAPCLSPPLTHLVSSRVRDTFTLVTPPSTDSLSSDQDNDDEKEEEENGEGDIISRRTLLSPSSVGKQVQDLEQEHQQTQQHGKREEKKEEERGQTKKDGSVGPDDFAITDSLISNEEGTLIVEDEQQQSGQEGAACSRSLGPACSAPEIFRHDEIVTLRLIFSLFDDNGDDYVDMDELVRYAEETGDSASLHQAEECIRLLDVDGDGRIGLFDYVILAARLKEVHRANQFSLVMCEVRRHFLEKSRSFRTHD